MSTTNNGMEDSGLYRVARPRETVDESIFKTEPCVEKNNTPILTYKDVPYRAALTFNAGVIKKDDKYIMIFRNDVGDFEKQKPRR